MFTTAFKNKLSLLLVLLVSLYSLGISAFNGLNDPQAVHEHLEHDSYLSPDHEEGLEAHEDHHDHEDSFLIHKHEHRHSPNAPLHEHSHSDLPGLQNISIVLNSPLGDLKLPDIDQFFIVSLDQIHRNAFLYSIFRPPILQA